jgi:hypothetical protein
LTSVTEPPLPPIVGAGGTVCHEHVGPPQHEGVRAVRASMCPWSGWSGGIGR